MSPRAILLLLLIVVLAAVPAFAGSSQTFLAIVFAKSLAVLGILLLLQAGQVSFGHGMFFATGAYTVAFLGRSLGGDLALWSAGKIQRLGPPSQVLEDPEVIRTVIGV